ncbi:hypothetical protein U1Q18_019383 [Sarracenia purpurea var. burkii]
MASNLPFQVEDQTDEDFFDKLVDDDDDDSGFKVAAPAERSFSDGNDSDEVKAFADLSIGEVAAGSEVSGGEGGTEAKGEATRRDVNSPSLDGLVEESESLVPFNSSGFDSVIESNASAIGMEETSDSPVHKINGSAGSGVKEVQWAAFNSDLGQNGINGFGSYSDFFNELGDGVVDQTGKVMDNSSTECNFGFGTEELKTSSDYTNYSSGQHQESKAYDAAMGQKSDGQDLNDSQYWENLYPGWKYDPSTGQWYQVEGYDTTGNVGSFDSNSANDLVVSDWNSQVSRLQQTPQSFGGTVINSGTTESVTNWNQSSRESGTTENVTNWNQVSQESGIAEGVSNWGEVAQGNNEYPAHMVFDPQYPGWYYDMVAQEWQSLETYTSSLQSTVQAHDQLSQNGFASTATFSQENDQKTYGDYGQVDNYSSQGFDAQSQDYNPPGSFSNINHQGPNIWQPETVTKSDTPMDFCGNPLVENDYGSNFSVNNHGNQHKSYVSSETVPLYENATQFHSNFTPIGSKGFVPSGNVSQQVNQLGIQQNEQMTVSNDYYGNQNPIQFSQQRFRSGHEVSYAPNAGRSSAGRPPHALVTFGFGGKLIVTKDGSSLSSSSYESQGPLGGSIYVLNLMEILTEKTDASRIGVGNFDYLTTLCRQSFPGPLVGGNAGSKELSKWIDERIANCGSPDMDCRKGDALRLLLSLLKIAFQHYGKFRSPFGSDTTLREMDVPESAVARLLHLPRGMKLPPEGQLQATAAEVQSLLVSGRKNEALHRASEGQLWGPALVLAAQLGEQFYVDTVKQMALRQLVAGSPLRTLCLLIAGQPADVFSTETTYGSSASAAVNMGSQPAQLQYGGNSMLDDWEENLAVITANRTKDDELVLIHLGDSLWKDRSEIIAAHICYLVAEGNFEPYSDSARLCLIGADHWKFPRTYASPDAIQFWSSKFLVVWPSLIGRMLIYMVLHVMSTKYVKVASSYHPQYSGFSFPYPWEFPRVPIQFLIGGPSIKEGEQMRWTNRTAYRGVYRG